MNFVSEKNYLNILLIEESSEDRKYIRKLLTENKIFVVNIIEANYLSKALQLIMKEPFDIILLNLSLHDSQKLGTLDKIASCNLSLPIMILTDIYDEELYQQVIQRGSQQCLVKKELNSYKLNQAIFHAIECKKLENQLNANPRWFLTQYHINKIIINISDEMSLLQELCSILVVISGYHSVWIASIEGEQEINPIAQYGFEEGFINKLKISNNHKQEKSPVQKSIKAKNSYLVRNILKEAQWVVGLDETLKSIITSLLVLPLIYHEKIVGVVNIFSSNPSDFNIKEVQLLMDMVSNLAFKIVTKRFHDKKEFFEKTIKEKSILIEATTNCILLIDIDFNVVFTNQAYLNLFDLTEDDVIGKNILDIPGIEKQRPEELEKFLPLLEMSFGGKVQFPIEMTIITSEKKEVVLSIRGEIIKNDEGTPTYLVVEMKDITEQKRKEVEILKIKTYFESSFQSIPDGVLLLDTQGKFTYLNPSFLRWLDRNSDEFIGKSVQEVQPPFMTPETTKIIAERVKKRLKTELSISGAEVELISKNNLKIPVIYSAAGIKDDRGDILGEIVFLKDISRRKQIENALLRSQEDLSSAINALNHPFYVINAHDYTIQLMNSATRKKFGEKTENSTCYSLIHNLKEPCSNDNHPCPLKNVILTKKPSIAIHQHKLSEGINKWYEVNAYPIFNLKGDVSKVIEYSIDISERKQVEDKLLESEKQYRSLFENSPIALLEEDFSEVKNYLQNLNKSKISDYKTFFQHNPKELSKCIQKVKLINVNKTMLRLLNLPTLKALLDRYYRFIKDEFNSFLKEQVIFLAEGYIKYNSETTLTTSSGEDIHVSYGLSVPPGYEKSLKKVMVAIEDITERRRIEEDLMQSEMELRIINDIAKNFLVIPDETVYHEILKIICIAIDSEAGLIGYIIDKESMICHSFRKGSPPERIIFTRESWENIWGQVLEEKRMIYTNEPIETPDNFIPINRVIGTPFLYQNEVIGLMYVANKLSNYTDKEMRFLQNITNYIAPILYARIQKDLQERNRQLAEKALRKEKDLVQKYLNIAGVMIIALNKDHNITLINKRGTEILGYKEDEIINKNWLNNFIPEERREYVKEIYEEIMEQGISKEEYIEDWIIAKGNVKKVIGWYHSTYKDEEDRIVSMLSSGQDITQRKETEIGLLRSEFRFRSLFDESPVSLWEEDFSTVKEYLKKIQNSGVKDFRSYFKKNPKELSKCVEMVIILNTNKATLNLFQVKTKEDFKIKIRKFYSKDASVSFLEEIIAFSEGKTKFKSEIQIQIQTGEKKYLLLYVSVVSGFEKTLEEILISVEDITEQKKAENYLIKAKDLLTKQVQEKTYALSKEKLHIEKIIETVPSSILVLDPNGSLRLANKTFRKLYKKLFNKQLSKQFNIHQYHTSSILIESIRDLIDSKRSDSRIIQPITGINLALQASLVGLPEEEPFAIIIEGRDISHFLELDKIRKQFISVISHELRTPITSISLSIQNLMKHKNRLSELQKDELVNMISDNSLLLNQMVEDLLTISRIEVGRFKIEPTTYSLCKIVKDVFMQLEPKRNEKNISIKFNIDQEIELFGDPRRISQIIRILIDNSIKYSPPESTICIKIISKYHGKLNLKGIEGTLIQVSDMGIGISNNDLPHIFTRYYRSERVRDTQGTGLGLFIAKELTERHDGSIFVESELEKGSTFSIFLPLLKKSKDFES